MPLLELDLCHIKTISNPDMGHIWVTPAAALGLWTLSPRFLRGFVYPEPTIDFLYSSAVSHSKIRHFRFLGHFRSCDFRSRHFRSLPVPVASFPVTSGSGDVISSYIKTRPRPQHQNEAKCAIRAHSTTVIFKG